AAAQRHVTGRFANQSLQPAVEVGAWLYFLEETVWRRLELIHRDAYDVSSGFVSASADRFHHAGIAAGANFKTRFNQKPSQLERIDVFPRLGSTTRASKNRDPFCHWRFSPCPFSLRPVLTFAVQRVSRRAHGFSRYSILGKGIVSRICSIPHSH